jgi:ubiquinone/menaquinone biosynthesis C-methylase UbiE
MEAAEEAYAKEMSSKEIVEFFNRTRIRDISSFRSLCNALKSQVMHQAVHSWKISCSGRVSVLDLGCGRGGDLRKWASLRLKSYVGLDASSSSIDEATSRHASLVAQGQSSLKASFHVTDIISEPLPIPGESVDIVSSMFFLQFSFASRASATLVMGELTRVLKKDGILCCLLPDGDMVHGLLSERKTPPSFGHFKLVKCAWGDDGPFGLAYNYCLSSAGWCTEYLVSSKMLASLLTEKGFQPVFEDASFFRGAQQVLSSEAESQTVSVILRGQKCSQVDWLSLGFFHVLLARKVEVPTPSPQELMGDRRSSRRRTLPPRDERTEPLPTQTP